MSRKHDGTAFGPYTKEHIDQCLEALPAEFELQRKLVHDNDTDELEVDYRVILRDDEDIVQDTSWFAPDVCNGWLMIGHGPSMGAAIEAASQNLPRLREEWPAYAAYLDGED